MIFSFSQSRQSVVTAWSTLKLSLMTVLFHLPDNLGEDEGLAEACWRELRLSFLTAADAALVGRLEVRWLIFRPRMVLALEGTPAEADFFSSSHAAKILRATCPLTHRSRWPVEQHTNSPYLSPHVSHGISLKNFLVQEPGLIQSDQFFVRGKDRKFGVTAEQNRLRYHWCHVIL